MRGPGSIPTGGNIFSKFYNPNLHNIARSDSLWFKTKNPSVSITDCFTDRIPILSVNVNLTDTDPTSQIAFCLIAVSRRQTNRRSCCE